MHHLQKPHDLRNLSPEHALKVRTIYIEADVAGKSVPHPSNNYQGFAPKDTIVRMGVLISDLWNFPEGD